MRAHATFGAILASVTVLLAACTPAPTPSPAPSPSTPSGPLAVYPMPDIGMDALLAGTLQLRDGCVVVEISDDSFTVPVFPEDLVSWSDDASTLTWQGKSYRVGDEISVGGGNSSAELEGSYVPEACAGDEPFLVSP